MLSSTLRRMASIAVVIKSLLRCATFCESPMLATPAATAISLAVRVLPPNTSPSLVRRYPVLRGPTVTFVKQLDVFQMQRFSYCSTMCLSNVTSTRHGTLYVYSPEFSLHSHVIQPGTHRPSQVKTHRAYGNLFQPHRPARIRSIE